MAKLPRRKCKVCREWFSPAYSNVVWCCPEHGAIYALELRARRIRDKYQTDPNARRTPQFKDRHCVITGIFVPVNQGGLFF